MKNLKKIAKEKNMSLLSLSVKLGISQEAVSQYISGKIYPKVSVLLDMAKILNVSVDYLLDLTDDPKGYNIKLSERETSLLDNYNSLDEKGKLKADSYMQALHDITEKL